MTPIVILTRNDIGPKLGRYATAMRVGIRQAVRVMAKGVTRRLLEITPPSNGEATGRDAKKAGELKIYTQMSRVLAPVKIKGRRLVSQAWGKKLKRPRYIPTKERFPDVAGLYRAQLHARKGVGFAVGRRVAKHYVDERKFKAILKERQGNVGKLASGWAAAAAALDQPVQAWIRRHGTSRGRIQVLEDSGYYRVEVTNLAPSLPDDVRAELARRIPYAIRYQGNAMERAVEGYHNRVRAQLGIRGKDRAAA